MSTLKTYRRAVAREFGSFSVGRATAGTTSSVLEIATHPFKSTVDVASTFDDRFMYRPTASDPTDRERMVQSWQPSAGRFLPSLPWTIAPYNAGDGEEVEFHLLPVAIDTEQSLHALINAALKLIWVPWEVALEPEEDQTRHGLKLAMPWLQDPNDVLSVGWLADSNDRNTAMDDPWITNPIHGEVYRDGDELVLKHPGRTFRASDTIFLMTLRSADTLCRAAGGEWGQQTGLVLDDDEAMVPCDDWLVSATLLIAWRRVANVLSEGGAEKNQQMAAAWFSDEVRKHFSASMPQRTFKPRIRHLGPYRSRAWR